MAYHSLQGATPTNLHLVRSRAMTFSLILEHWQTQQLKFVTVEDCLDMDDCINHIRETDPAFDIIQITHAF